MHLHVYKTCRYRYILPSSMHVHLFKNHFDTNTKINTLKQSPSICHAMLIDRFAVKLHV